MLDSSTVIFPVRLILPIYFADNDLRFVIGEIPSRFFFQVSEPLILQGAPLPGRHGVRSSILELEDRCTYLLLTSWQEQMPADDWLSQHSFWSELTTPERLGLRIIENDSDSIAIPPPDEGQ